MKKLVIISCLQLVTAISIHAQNTEFPKLTGPYLGQNAPGMKPEIFAPGVISLKESVHSSPAFSPDGKEVFWTVMPENGPFRIKGMIVRDGRWSKPFLAPFSGPEDDSNPFFSFDGSRVLFKSIRNSKNSIWAATREGGSWSNPVELSPLVSSPYLAWQFSMAKNGNLYFVLAKDGFGSHDIFCSRFADRVYQKPQKIGPPVSSPGDDFQPFISPEEDCLIFSRYYPEEQTTRLLIAFRGADGSWMEAVTMGDEINKTNASWPMVSHDGRYLFFVSSRNNNHYHYNVYWISAKIIEELRPKG